MILFSSAYCFLNVKPSCYQLRSFLPASANFDNSDWFICNVYITCAHITSWIRSKRKSAESEATKKMADEELNLPGPFGYGDLSGMSQMSQFDEDGLPNSNEEERGTVPEPTNTRVTQIPPKKRERKAKEKEAAFPWKDELRATSILHCGCTRKIEWFKTMCFDPQV